MLPVVLIGYGKMGRMLEAEAPSCGVEVIGRIDPHAHEAISELNPGLFPQARVFIDFSLTDSVMSNARTVLTAGKKLVIGTTGWQEHLPELAALVQQYDGAVVHGGNFSPGMNFFYTLVKLAAGLFSPGQNYDVYGSEAHHRTKADHPSGTARKLAQLIIQANPAKTELLTDCPAGPLKPCQLQFTSQRAGFITGRHTVGFSSPWDEVELTHTAQSRTGFARGALQAAVWLDNHQGIYDIANICTEVFA